MKIKKGDRLRFKENYVTESGIIISTKAVGKVVSAEVIAGRVIEDEITVHFETNGIIFPITKYFSSIFTPEALFNVMKEEY